MSTPGGVLDPRQARLSGVAATGAASFERAVIRERLVETYLRREPTALQLGFAAVITAGPPGAGKSVAVGGSYPSAEWRAIDADVVKDLILVDEIAVGTFAAQLGLRLTDGYPVMARELAGLVHQESVIIADIIRRRCLAEGENVVIEGTLGWPPHGPRLLRELAAAGYDRVDIVAVDVLRDIAIERAAARWWTGRQAAIAGGDPLGGRFTPPGAVNDKYDDAGASICLANARATYDDPMTDLFDQVRLIVHSTGRTETLTKNRSA